MRKVYLRLIFVVGLIFVIYAMFLGYYLIKQREEIFQRNLNGYRYKLIALSDVGKPEEVSNFKLVGDVGNRKILFDLLTFKKDNSEIEKKLSYVLPYPYKMLGDESVPRRLRNLLECRNKGEWLFYNQAEDEYHFKSFKVKYDDENNRLIIDDIRDKKDESLYGEYFTGMGQENKSLLDRWGSFRIIDGEDPFRKYGQNAKVMQKLRGPPTGASFLNETDIVWQGAGNDKIKVGRFTFLPNIVLINSPEEKNNRTLESGLFPLRPSYKENEMNPIGVSPEGKEIAFCALYANDQKSDAYLWLTVWKTFDNSVDKIISLPSMEKKENIYSLGSYEKFIRWCPVSGKKLVAVSSYQGIFIIDTACKKILKMIDCGDVWSMRWSPDGEKLGFVREGNLFIYDLRQDSLRVLDEGENYFDFFWVQ